MRAGLFSAIFSRPEPAYAGSGFSASSEVHRDTGSTYMASATNRPKRVVDAVRRRTVTAPSGARLRAPTPWRRKTTSSGSSLGSLSNSGGGSGTTTGSGLGSSWRPRVGRGRSGCGCGCLTVIVIIIVLVVVAYLWGGFDLGGFLGGLGV